MKKFTILSLVTLFLALLSTPKAEAQNYPSRVLSVCPVCHQNVYAYYRPVAYNGCLQHVWVPVYHTSCAARSHSSRTVTRYHRGTPYNYVVPQRSSIRYTPRYSGYTRPGVSITIRR